MPLLHLFARFCYRLNEMSLAISVKLETTTINLS
jgi:hypothetical protein